MIPCSGPHYLGPTACAFDLHCPVYIDPKVASRTFVENNFALRPSDCWYRTIAEALQLPATAHPAHPGDRSICIYACIYEKIIHIYEYLFEYYDI